MPHPKIEIAPQDEVDQFPELGAQFFELILQKNLDHILITDMSDLTDFTGYKELENYHKKIEKYYGVNVRPSNNLVEIFKKLIGHNPRNIH